MNINYGWLGQFFTAWGIAAFIAAPFIGSYLRKRRVRKEFQALVGKPYIDIASEAEADRRRDRLQASFDEAARRILASDAVTPISESKWQQNARIAESLGFDHQVEPKRTA